MAFNTKMGYALKDMIESLGSDGAIRTVKEMLQKEELNPMDFSLKEVALACETADLREANTSDLFPRLTGELINNQVIRGYDDPDLIGDRLVTVVPSKLKTDKLAQIAGLDMPDEVPENQEYSESLMEEDDYITSDNKKFGRLLSISEEALHFDRTGEKYEKSE